MGNRRAVVILFVIAALLGGHAFATPVVHVRPAMEPRVVLESMTPREEAAEDRAEAAFRIRRENAEHQLALHLKRCGPQQGACAGQAQAEYRSQVDDAQQAYASSHARALLLGKMAP